jgi:DNA-binding GntR family transcriptional regulator
LKKGQTKKPAAAKAVKTAARGGDKEAAHHLPSVQEICDEIVKLIEEDVFSPGERLREQDLADRFGVTRGRVREVLHSLEARGFIVIERMKGAAVARHDKREFKAIAQVRARLVSLAALRAAEDSTKPERDEIVKLAKDLVAKGPDMSAQDFRLATIRLVFAICDAAHSGFLRRIIDDVHRMPTSGRALRNLIVADRDRRVYAGKKWKSVAEAIAKGDGAKASALVDEIYASGLSAMEQLIEASGS